MIVRGERPSGVKAIAGVTETTFRALAISRHTEQLIGHAVFSPVTFSNRSMRIG